MANETRAIERDLPWFVKNPDPNIYFSNNFITLDLETTNEDFGNPVVPENRLLLAVARRSRAGNEEGKKDDEYLKVWGSEYEQQELLLWIEEADFIIAQGAKFELGWLRRMGVDLHKIIVWDTLLGKYVWDGNRKNKRDLDSLCSFYDVPVKEQHVKTLIHELGVNPEDIPRDWLEDYCTQDVDSTYEVFIKQRQQLKEAGLIPVMFTRCFATPMLTDLEFNGMQLDCERINTLFNKANDENKQASAALQECSGGINTNSSKQLAEYLYERLGFREPTDFRGNPIRTGTGKRTTSAKHLEQLRPRNHAQSNFLACYKKQSKIDDVLTKYLKKFKSCVDEAGGLLYARFNQAITSTQRLSSSGGKYKIQFQNMARWLKPVFTTRNPDWYVGEIDFAQLEFRIAVWLGNDKVGRQKIAEKFDVHSFTSEELTRNGQPTNRQDSKEHTFKPLYGGQSGTDAEIAYYKAFRKMYPDITSTQTGWAKQVLKNKKLVLPHGFVFYWPDCKVTNTGYITHTPEIYNYPVQHFATAEIVLIGVTILWHLMYCAMMESFLVNTVHDSAIGEIHPKERELFHDLAVKACDEEVVRYLKVVYDIDFDVPLEIEASFGKHWADKGDWSEKYLNPNKQLIGG
jgi:DNA polymerase I-like protein with 3'-5' exonuclease and polymerase domains